MIKEWLTTYRPANQEDATHALREIMQEVALAGLYRADFFKKTAFHGGAALRIFYGLNHYSEDLDFSLLEPDPEFSLENYLTGIVAEFEAAGMQVSIREKQKTSCSAVDSAFLKSETVWRELVLEEVIPARGLDQIARVKIKIEVDTLPPPGFATEEKLLLKPFSLYVKCFTLPDLFAGKMHALLFRKWGTNVKGRDWFDLEWYIQKGVALHLDHFVKRARDSRDWPKTTMTLEELGQLLSEKIESVDMERVKADISRFIPDLRVLDIWSAGYFRDLVGYLKVV